MSTASRERKAAARRWRRWRRWVRECGVFDAVRAAWRDQILYGTGAVRVTQAGARHVPIAYVTGIDEAAGTITVGDGPPEPGVVMRHKVETRWVPADASNFTPGPSAISYDDGKTWWPK